MLPCKLQQCGLGGKDKAVAVRQSRSRFSSPTAPDITQPPTGRMTKFANMKTHFLAHLIFAILACTSWANSYAYQPLSRIPKADEIIVFTNGPRPAAGSRTKVLREEIEVLLTKGVPIKDCSKWKRPEILTNSNQKDGVFFAKDGTAYFWRIRVPGTLFLEVESGESIQLEIPQ